LYSVDKRYGLYGKFDEYAVRFRTAISISNPITGLADSCFERRSPAGHVKISRSMPRVRGGEEARAILVLLFGSLAATVWLGVGASSVGVRRSRHIRGHVGFTRVTLLIPSPLVEQQA
jgi:hypothetical protein